MYTVCLFHLISCKVVCQRNNTSCASSSNVCNFASASSSFCAVITIPSYLRLAPVTGISAVNIPTSGIRILYKLKTAVEMSE
jgi:hypothetical protein